MVSTAGEQLRTESVVGFLAAPGAPAATAAYPLPAGYRIDGLSVDEDGVGVTYAAPRLQGTTYDEVRGRLVLRLKDDRFVEVGHTEQAVPMPAPNNSGSRQARALNGPARWRTAGGPFAQSAAADERLEIELTSAWGPPASPCSHRTATSSSHPRQAEPATSSRRRFRRLPDPRDRRRRQPVPYTINVSRASAPPPPAPSRRTGLPRCRPRAERRLPHLRRRAGPATRRRSSMPCAGTTPRHVLRRRQQSGGSSRHRRAGRG